MITAFLKKVVLSMCLILFAYHVHPKYKLIVAANRDEFYERSTLQAHFWEDCPNILAGRDLEKMGTWMGVTTTGRFAALTNYRNPKENTQGKRSRGELVARALKHEGKIQAFMQKVSEENTLYPGYNLLAGDINELFYYSNVGKELQKVRPGIYGLSNHLLNSNWPKVEKGKLELSKIIDGKRNVIGADLMGLLQYSDPFQDELLPDTGVSPEMERMLSPLFIKSDHYGTRSSTVLLASDNHAKYVERVFSKQGYKDNEYLIQW
ncbi:MAG TPA: NRDE family protein [Sporolactobacillaceae bacterium]|nr:NRDE family protein [Sporolactobacillaceae bacterium]